MQINKELNLVFKIGKVNVHATPMSFEAFEDNVLTLLFLNKKLSDIANNRDKSTVAYMVLKKIADKDGDDFKSLLREIKRGVYVIIDGNQEMLEVAIERGIFSNQQLNEVYSKILFFILSYHLPLQTHSDTQTSQDFLTYVIETCTSAAITSSNCTDYMKSLMTSTTEEPTDKKT